MRSTPNESLRTTRDLFSSADEEVTFKNETIAQLHEEIRILRGSNSSLEAQMVDTKFQLAVAKQESIVDRTRLARCKAKGIETVRLIENLTAMIADQTKQLATERQEQVAEIIKKIDDATSKINVNTDEQIEAAIDDIECVVNTARDNITSKVRASQHEIYNEINHQLRCHTADIYETVLCTHGILSREIIDVVSNVTAKVDDITERFGQVNIGSSPVPEKNLVEEISRSESPDGVVIEKADYDYN
jgi:hypothetical protein